MPIPANTLGYRLEEAGRPLQKAELSLTAPSPSEVIIQVAGCGVCHTDIGFAYQGVPTRHTLPLVLGHEISGRVIEAGESSREWMGQNVIVPAVIPCGDCPPCRVNRPTICRRQFMPGNDGDGGFATHVRVPSLGLCRVPDSLPAGCDLASLAVVADAVTTPFEAIRRAGLDQDDVAVIVGAGGIGSFAVQIAAARGAAVAAIDVDPARLELVSRHGAQLTLDARGMPEKDVKSAVRNFAKTSGKKGIGLKIFEMSGTPAGQATAFSLLDHGAHLAVVGFTPQKTEVRLSNLMAFDATACGNWGCPPAQYPAALSLVLEGKVKLEPFIEFHPLQSAPQVLEAVAHHAVKRRAILVPEGSPAPAKLEKQP